MKLRIASWPCTVGAVTTLLAAMAGCQAPAASAPASKPTSAAGAATAAPTAAAASAGSAATGPAASTAAAPSSATAPTAPPALAVVKLADPLAFVSAPLLIAVEKGYFREQGVDVQLEPVAGGADVIPQLAIGELDLTHGGISPAMFNAIERGVEIRV